VSGFKNRAHWIGETPSLIAQSRDHWKHAVVNRALIAFIQTGSRKHRNASKTCVTLRRVQLHDSSMFQPCIRYIRKYWKIYMKTKVIQVIPKLTRKQRQYAVSFLLLISESFFISSENMRLSFFNISIFILLILYYRSCTEIVYGNCACFKSTQLQKVNGIDNIPVPSMKLLNFSVIAETWFEILFSPAHDVIQYQCVFVKLCTSRSVKNLSNISSPIVLKICHKK